MINLLPLKEKKEIWLKEKLNLILNLEILFLIFLFFFGFTLCELRVFFENQVGVFKAILFQEKGISEFIGNLEQKIENFNNLCSKIYNFYTNQKLFYPILKEISDSFTQGITLNSLTATFNKEEKVILISVSGLAQKRENLLALKEKLQKNKNFIEVIFPPENWIKPENVEFTFILKAK